MNGSIRIIWLILILCGWGMLWFVTHWMRQEYIVRLYIFTRTPLCLFYTASTYIYIYTCSTQYIMDTCSVTRCKDCNVQCLKTEVIMRHLTAVLSVVTYVQVSQLLLITRILLLSGDVISVWIETYVYWYLVEVWWETLVDSNSNPLR